jgi:hypothetical protein
VAPGKDGSYTKHTPEDALNAVIEFQAQGATVFIEDQYGNFIDQAKLSEQRDPS